VSGPFARAQNKEAWASFSPLPIPFATLLI